MWICSSRSAPTSVRARSPRSSTHIRACSIGGEAGRGGRRRVGRGIVRASMGIGGGVVGRNDLLGGLDDGDGARAFLELEALGGAGADERDDLMAAADVDG